MEDKENIKGIVDTDDGDCDDEDLGDPFKKVQNRIISQRQEG